MIWKRWARRSRRAAAALLAIVALGGCATVPGRGRATPTELRAESALILVTLRAGGEARQSAIADQLHGLFGVRLSASWFLSSLGEQCLVMVPPAWTTAERAAAEVRGHPAVSGATPVRRFEVLADPVPDPYAQLQREALELPLADLHAASTGRGVTVAVVDTGVDFTHPDLAGRVTRAVDFVGRQRGRFQGDFHGTAVGGVIAAVAGNGIGGVGVAPGAELWALRACWHSPAGGTAAICDSYTLAQALDLVVTGAPRVLNLSLTGEHDELIERLVVAALERGVVVVAAAAGEPPSFPASVRGVIAVRSARAGRSAALPVAVASGALAAPGADLLTTVPGGGFDFVTGSSFAAAWTSGVVALLLERQPGIAPRSVVELLAMSALWTAEGPRVDPCAALARLTDREVCAPPQRAAPRLATTEEPPQP